MTTGYQINDVIAKYVEIRDEIERVAERHAAELKPFSDQKTLIENWLMGKMNEAGCDQFKSEAGTAFRSTTTRAKVADWQPLLDFIINGGEWDMLTHAVSGDAVKQYAAEHGGALPPGVKLNSVMSVKVRRA